MMELMGLRVNLRGNDAWSHKSLISFHPSSHSHTTNYHDVAESIHFHSFTRFGGMAVVVKATER